MTDPTIFDHLLLAFILAVGLYAVNIGQPKLKQLEVTSSMKISIYWSNAAFLWFAAILTVIVWVVGGRTLSDLGLTATHEAPLFGGILAALFVVLLGIDLWFDASTPERRARIHKRWKRDVPFLPETQREYAHFSLIGITAGITEEIIARGFLISYLAWYLPDSTIGLAAAVAIPAVGFAAAHWYQGIRAGVRIVITAIIFGAVFVLTGSLLIPILLHASVDLLSGALALKVHREHCALART